MKKLIGFITQYSLGLFILAVVAGSVSGMSNTAALAVINRGLTASGDEANRLLWMFVGLLVLLPLARIVAQTLLVSITQKAIFDLRIHLSRQILGSSLRKLEEYGPNRLLNALTNDVNSISSALVNIPFLCMHISILITCLAYLTYLYVPGGLAIIAIAVMGFFFFRFVVGRAKYHFGSAKAHEDTMFKHFKAITEGTKELKLHRPRREGFIKGILRITASSYRHHNVMANVYFAGAGSLGQVLFFALIGSTVFLLPRMETAITSEILTGYAMVLLYLFLPLEAISSIIPSLANAAISFGRIQALGISLKRVGHENTEIAVDSTDWQRLEYIGITHAYHHERANETFQLGPIDLCLEPGQLIFITGGNGSGKTTLAKLLLGLYVPEDGTVSLDGTIIDDDNREMLRQRFTGVFSDFFLFDSLIGLEATNMDAQAKAYLRKLQLDHKVTIEDGHFSTTDLSTGQRKRLALLTAYLEDRPIYLFDEWAADQDPLFKDVFYNALLPELKQQGKTVICISHDDHYYHVADRVIKLADGQMIESETSTTVP